MEYDNIKKVYRTTKVRGIVADSYIHGVLVNDICNEVGLSRPQLTSLLNWTKRHESYRFDIESSMKEERMERLKKPRVRRKTGG